MVGDTSCGGANEWSEDSGHAEDSSTYLVSPTVCWEWPGGAQVFVKFKYQLKHNFDGVNYHMMQYYQRDWRWGTPIQAESHTTEASQLRTIDTNPESLQATITLPNSPGCAFVSLQVDSPLSAVSDHLVYVRILTGLDDQPPESLEASLVDDSLNLIWAKRLHVETQIKRMPDSAMWVIDSAYTTFADTTGITTLLTRTGLATIVHRNGRTAPSIE